MTSEPKSTPKEMRSPEQIVSQTLDLARALYEIRGYLVPEGYRFDKATHPHEIEAWRAACAAQEMLTDTDPENALLEIEESTDE